MDARALVLSEDLRIWHDLGLHHVLCEQDVAALRPAQAAARPGAPAEPPRAPRPRQGGEPGPGAPAPPARHAAGKPGPAQAPARAKASTPGPEGRARGPEASASGSGAASGASAPQGPLAVFPWEQFRPRLAAPSRTVWTYWELGIDFGPQPDPERRALFRNIIKALQWPPNSVAFWPLSFEHQGRLLANKGSFLRGVGEAGAQTVICFGQQAFEVLFPRQPYATGRHRLEARTVIALPGPAEMLGGDAQAKRLTWDTLRALSL